MVPHGFTRAGKLIIYVKMEVNLKTKTDLFEALKPILVKYNIKQAAVFGSFARGDFTADSDVDIVVDMDYSLPLADNYYGFWDEAETVLGMSIDLLSLRSLHESTKHRFKQIVLNELEWFYEA